MTDPAYDLAMPARQHSCVIFASPHSGRDYPAAFLRDSVLDERAIRSSEDAFVDRLFDAAPDFGAPLLSARVPRAYVDLNRGVDELDPAVVAGVQRRGHNPRVASGLGVIPRVVANGRQIHRGKLSRSQAQERLDRCWHPYHATLKGLLAATHLQFGQAILVDCHSMPHEAIENMLGGGWARPEVVLGDRFGAAAGGEVVDRIEAAFSAAGLRVARNAPFAGAYVAQAYGRPERGQHAVQIEIDRSIYMDERQIAPRPDFDAFRALMRGVIAEIAAIGAADMPLAAE
ncbi:N-formylglutamate amidohydrolase [Pukyongiella litopenaei]|uniref:N-formylglutamate amidohydrolase n=1 Tax=Pukyongiella litopenaei TaxID=2605946 RepID=A0A2S0MLV8_9RHOB|nr:N-formylglutamate amidohydrolase [Pukyongiella litopenaei]AVO36862.1 N-formylglutamate amidohydrolase [Pukyongiella litopenaei]